MLKLFLFLGIFIITVLVVMVYGRSRKTVLDEKNGWVTTLEKVKESAQPLPITADLYFDDSVPSGEVIRMFTYKTKTKGKVKSDDGRSLENYTEENTYEVVLIRHNEDTTVYSQLQVYTFTHGSQHGHGEPDGKWYLMGSLDSLPDIRKMIELLDNR